MTRIDLDLFEESALTFAPDGWVRTYVPPFIAELRAAREVVEALRTDRDMHNYEDCDPGHPRGRDWGGTYECDACRMVRAYDEAVAP